MASSEGSNLPPFTPTTEFKYTTSPNPGWKYGQNIASTPAGQAWMEGEKEGWTVLDTSKEELRCVPRSCRPSNLGYSNQTSSLSNRKIYSNMISGIIPRPVAFVSSISEDGFENLAPFRSSIHLIFEISTHSTYACSPLKLVQSSERLSKG
jgi:hypothetical protein